MIKEGGAVSQGRLDPEEEGWIVDLANDQVIYAKVPKWLIKHSGLKDKSLRVWCVLKTYAGPNGSPFPGRKRLATDLGCSVDTIDNAIKELKKVGAVVVVHRWRVSDPSRDDYGEWRDQPGPGCSNQSNLYELAWDPPEGRANEDAYVQVRGSRKSSATPSQGGGGKSSATPGRDSSAPGGGASSATGAEPVRPELDQEELDLVSNDLEVVVAATPADEWFDSLEGAWQVGPESRDKLRVAVNAALAGGWTPSELTARLTARPPAQIHAGGLLAARLRDLPAAPRRAGAAAAEEAATRISASTKAAVDDAAARAACQLGCNEHGRLPGYGECPHDAEAVERGRQVRAAAWAVTPPARGRAAT